MKITVATLQDLYGPKVKIIHVTRHGIKGKDGKHITLGCLDNIIRNGLPRLDPRTNVLQHGTDLVRSDETGTAASLWIMRQGGKIEKHLPSMPEITSDALFKKAYTTEVDHAVEVKGMSDYKAVKTYNPEVFKDWEETLQKVIETVFSKLSESDICLLPCHSPTVEIIYNIYAKEKNPDMIMKMLHGIFVIMNENGKIITHY